MSKVLGRTRLISLKVGNNGIDDNEAISHFSMWALMSSPLIIGTDVRTLTAPNLAIYLNPAVIALNQGVFAPRSIDAVHTHSNT